MKKIIIALLFAVMTVVCVTTVDVRADEFTDERYNAWADANARYEKYNRKYEKTGNMKYLWKRVDANNERFDAHKRYFEEGMQHTLEIDYFDADCLALVAYCWNEYDSNITKVRLIQKIADQYTAELGIEPVKVMYADYSWSEYWIDGINYQIAGEYDNEHRWVALSDDWFINKSTTTTYDGKQVLETLLHEIRHAWQYDNGYDFSNYFYSYDGSNRDAYLNQDVEIDAEEYAASELEGMWSAWHKIAYDNMKY